MVRSSLEGTKWEGKGQFKWLGSASHLSTAVSACQTYEHLPFPAPFRGSSMLQVLCFHPAQYSSTSLFWLLLFFLHRSSSKYPPDKKDTQLKKKKKKKPCLELSPIPPLARAQLSANVSALQGTAECKIKQISPRTRQAHTRCWHRAG